MNFSSYIFLKGCRQHNLKNFSISLPKSSVIAITGVSGSGKSSLAFDTLFAEGQRRYLEYLSSQTRSLVKQSAKPDVDFIEGLSPTLALSQKLTPLYARGTVATYTDIYDFLSLLFSAVGQQHSPINGKKLIRYTRQEMIQTIINEYPEQTKIHLVAPISLGQENGFDALVRLQKMGFVRFRINGMLWMSGDEPMVTPLHSIEVIVDRIQIKEGILDRLSASVETALDLSFGILKIEECDSQKERYFTEIFVCPETGFSFPPLKSSDFNFNSPHGACPVCHGKGRQPRTEELLLCTECEGKRLKKESLFCLINGKNIAELCSLSVSDLIKEMNEWIFDGKEAVIVQEILPNILSRLHFLDQVGLSYLELDREGGGLSRGEAHRIQLAAHIGAKLSGLIYILDEPSLGLHRQDISKLQIVIDQLRNLNNTVILVDHEKELIATADHIVEVGPLAGKLGGEITFQGTYSELLNDTKSLTGAWLSKKKTFPQPRHRKITKNYLSVINATHHNLNNFSVNIPLGCLVGFCGVSGSGKSTLLFDVIGHPCKQYLSHGRDVEPHFLKGCDSFKRVILGEQFEEHFSSRSIPASYVNIMSPLRKLFAETKLAKARGYTAARFSLNKPGGRCETCQGQGELKVSMDFLPDLLIPCDQCHGDRYHYETLQVNFEGKNIAEVLNMSISEAAQLFRFIPSLYPTLKLLEELGLGYLSLGQPFKTLSGGEIQRLKLVCDLLNKTEEPTLYILDEPSSGLHFEDIEKLVRILHRLVDYGHTVFFIEHHLDMLTQADWLIEMGPGGGPAGGRLIFEGTVKKLMTTSTPTGNVLKKNK